MALERSSSGSRVPVEVEMEVAVAVAGAVKDKLPSEFQPFARQLFSWLVACEQLAPLLFFAPSARFNSHTYSSVGLAIWAGFLVGWLAAAPRKIQPVVRAKELTRARELHWAAAICVDGGQASPLCCTVAG